MKKFKILSVAAFVFAIGSAFAPKTMEGLSNKKSINVFVPTGQCLQKLDCPSTGNTLCGYLNAGCQHPIMKP